LAPVAAAGVAPSGAPATVARAALTAAAGAGEAPPPGPIGAVNMRFDWGEPVAAAVFRRADYLWVAFDRPKQVDIDALRKAGGNVVRGIEQMPIANATVLRMDTVSGVNPTVRRDALAWILDFQKQPMAPQTPIEAKAQAGQVPGARVFLPVPEPGNALAVADPEVGDTVVVIPVIPLGHGIGNPYDFPQFRILPSSQGVVIQPRIDTLRVRPLRQGIELTSSETLQISPVSAAAAVGTTLAATGPLTQVFELEKWRGGDPNAYVGQEQRLLAAAAKAGQDTAKERARLDLARFYFAHAFAPEALGVLDVMAGARPAILDEAEFRALRGGSNFLLDRIPEADEDWYNASLNNNNEATMWRAAIAVRQGDPVQASRVLRRTGGLIRGYPQALKMPMGILIAQAAIDVGDIRQAQHYLELLSVDQPNPSQKARIGLVEGRLLELSGDFNGAIAKWDEVELGPDRLSRVKAVVARTELLLKLEKITRPEAIQQFEKMRFAWRGDEFEFKLLRRLGHLYLEEGDYRNGLMTLRQAVTHFQDHKEAPAVTQEMTDAFAHLYLEGGADALPPVTAIALYDEFKELTPAGPKGDEMIRNLADRLVGVDLLDRGAALLDSQIEFRLRGEEKARVGARLALIRLMANQPEKAVAALDASEIGGLPADLTAKRRDLRARANYQLGQSEKALALLNNDDSADAERIRTEVYWAGQDWANAAQSLGRLIKATGASPKTPLDERQALNVLSMAIALTLSGNERGIARVRTEYGPLMDSTSYRDAFRLIATPQTGALMDIKTIASKVKDVDQFRSFLTEYQDSLKKKKLSELFTRNSPIPSS